MRKILATLAFAAGALLLFFAAAAFAFYHMIQVGELRRFLVGEFEARSGLKLEIGAAEIEVGRVLGVSFHDLALKNADGTMTVVAARKALIRVALLPLFQRRIVFYAVHLDAPRAEIVRDERGKVPWLDLLSSLPFRRQQNSEFSLDLRELRIDRGEILFTDRSGGEGPVETRFQTIDLALHRIRGAGLRQALQAFKSDIPAGPGLDFDFKTVVRRAERQADVAVNGRSFFADDELDVGRAHVDAYVSSSASPAAFLWDVAGRPAAENPPRGNLTYRLHWQGSLDRGARVGGEVHFAGVEAELPEYFPAPLDFGNGRLDLVANWNPQALRIERLDLHSNRLEFSARGSVAPLSASDARLALRVTTPFLPLTVARSYWPAKLLQSPRLDALTAAVGSGEIRLASAEVAGMLSDLRRIPQGGGDDSLSFTIEMRNVGGEWAGERPLPFSAAGGQLVLEKGTLYYKNFRATLGRSQVTELSGAQRRPFAGGALDLRVRGEADLAQARQYLPPGAVAASAGKTLEALRDLSGRARVDLALHAEAAAPLSYSGAAALDNVHVRIGDFALNQIRGDVSFAPGEIKAERARATLNGADLQLSVLLKDLAGAATYDVAIESQAVKAPDALGLLLPLDVSKSPGFVRGNVRFSGPFAAPEAKKVTGQLELVGVQIPVPVFDEPFREVNGRVRIAGASIDLEGMRARIGGDAIALDGRWTGGERPMLVFQLASSDLDIRNILPHHVTPEDEWYERLQVRGKFALVKASYDSFAFTDLKTDLVLDRRTWRLERFSARAQGGTIEGSGAFRDRGEPGTFTIEPDIRGVPLQTMLGWFNVGHNEVTGNVRLSGKFEFAGKTSEERRRSLNGALRVRIDDGMMRRFQIAVRVLSFLDLSRWFTLKLPNINQEGIRFRSISADMKIAQGIYTTENFLLDGDDLRITGAGDLDGTKGEIDFVIAVRPFPGLDHAWNYIPVLGTGLAAVKNSLLVASFHVHGPINDASVMPAPLSTLSEFFYGALAIPKGLIGLPTTPSAPKEPAPAAAKEPAPSAPTEPAPAK